MTTDNPAPAAPGLIGLGHEGSRSKKTFALHFVEMVVVMFIGMGIFSGLAALAYAAAGSSLSDQPGPWRVLLMGINMAVPMALWMAFRGHSAARNLEMAAAMLVPSIGAAVVDWTGAVDTVAAMEIQHLVMIPAMLGVMLWRYDEYSRHTHRRTAD